MRKWPDTGVGLILLVTLTGVLILLTIWMLGL